MKWCVVVILCSLAGAANAESDDPAERRDEAAQLFERARRQKEDGNLDKACKNFQLSYELEPAAGTALNLAECEETAGNWQYAMELYEGAAKVFEKTDRAEAAEIARDRANVIRFKHPTGEAKPASPARSSSKTALGIGVGGLTISAVAGLFWFFAYQEIEEFRDLDLSGTLVTMISGGVKMGTITDADCGNLIFSDPQAQVKFEDSCSAVRRERYLQPITFISGAVGIGAMLYWYWSRPSQGKSVAVVPSASGAAVTATFEW